MATSHGGAGVWLKSCYHNRKALIGAYHMKKRKPPFLLFSILLAFVGVAVVFGGRLMNDVNHDEAHAMKEAMAKKEQEVATKPKEKRDEAASLVDSVKKNAGGDESGAPKNLVETPTGPAPAPGPKGMAMNAQMPSTILVPKQLTAKPERTDISTSSLRYVNQAKKKNTKGK